MRSPFRNLIFVILGTAIILAHPFSSMADEVWTNLGLYGGKVFDIAIDPVNPDKMLLGMYMGDGLYLSEEGGNTWQGVEADGQLPGEDEFKDHAVWAVKIAPSDNNVIWVAHNYWVEKSTDGGQTWTHIWNSTMQRDCTDCGGEGDNFRFCRSLAVDSSDPQRVYVGTGGPYGTDLSGAVYKTEDGGETWTKMNDGSDFDFGVVDMDIDPQNNNTIWAVTDSAGAGGVWGGTLYRSGDGGETWSPIFSLTPSGARYFTVAVKPNDPNVVFTGSGPGIIKHYSLDGGVTWDKEYPIEGDSTYVQNLQFDPQDTETLYASWKRRDHPGWAVGRSSKGGESGTWKIYTTPNNDFYSLAVHPRNTKDRVTEVIFAGDFNLGIYKGIYDSQADDYSWTPVNNGINSVIVYDVAIDPNDRDHILAGTFSGVYEKRAEEAWSHILEYSTRSVQFHPTNSQIFYAGLEGQLAKTMDGGESWTFSNYLGWFNCFNDIAIKPTNTDWIFIASSYGEIYKSTDGGNTLNKVLDGVNQSGENYAFNVVAIDPSDHYHIFAGGGNFYAPKVLGDLWESTDGGVTWDRNSLSFKDVIVNDFLVDPGNPDIMYAGCGYSGGTLVPLYKSTDGGVTWTESFEGIPDNAVVDMEFHNQNSNVLYAASYGAGVYVSRNQIEEWLNLGTPEHLVFTISPGSLYVGLNGGVYQCTGTGTIAGQVTHRDTGDSIDDAMVSTDLGVVTITVNGEYMMVSPSGICTVTVIKEGYINKSVENVTVYGGGVTRLNIAMAAGGSNPPPNGGGGGSGGGGCFIETPAVDLIWPNKLRFFVHSQMISFCDMRSSKKWLPDIAGHKNPSECTWIPLHGQKVQQGLLNLGRLSPAGVVTDKCPCLEEVTGKTVK